MTDTVTVTLQAQGHPDLLYRDRIITPETITLVYRLDTPTPTPEGIYPIRAEVEGRARSARPTSIGMGRRRNRRAAWLYRTHPEHWPAWLIKLGAQHRPQHQQ